MQFEFAVDMTVLEMVAVVIAVSIFGGVCFSFGKLIAETMVGLGRRLADTMFE